MMQMPVPDLDSVAAHAITPTRLEAAILALLAIRATGATICPSEAARAVASAAGVRCRPLMAATRLAALRLAASGRIDVIQRGKCVDASRVRGPIRLRLRASTD